ncbi:RNA polymerase factor sigma-54 [Planctomycetaceae bacterium AH-315-I19]|nr:RNA polymerase factor sigma-54 [Planctomycetaceae bacterium AH-315-I19]
MRFDTSQHMKMGQSMKLAPRMIESMEILQASQQELEERIEQELESNATLELAEPTQEAEDAAPRDETVETSDSEDFSRVADLERVYGEDVNADASPNERERTRASDYEPSSYSASRMSGERDAKIDAMANTEASGESLAEQLSHQWSVVDVDESLRDAGELIIAHIDDDGYLRSTPSEMLKAAPRALAKALNDEILERALLAVQLFLDPPGVGARDARECLLLQIDSIAETRGAIDLTNARRIIEEHYDDLLHNRIPKITDATGLTFDEVNAALEQLRRLTLRPGLDLVDDRPANIVPDAIVEYDEDSDRYIVYLSENRHANLTVNREYAKMARDKDVPKDQREFLRKSLSNATWLIDAINQRRSTLLRVVNAVVSAQREYLDVGSQALRPLPMTQVADQLGIHVATVSRAVSGKYIQTPRGIVALRKLFSGGTQTDEGDDMSWEAVRAALQDIIDVEDKSKPLSDEKLVAALKDRGIEIARRTVAKYRNQMSIPSARIRKQF